MSLFNLTLYWIEHIDGFLGGDDDNSQWRMAHLPEINVQDSAAYVCHRLFVGPTVHSTGSFNSVFGVVILRSFLLGLPFTPQVRLTVRLELLFCVHFCFHLSITMSWGRCSLEVTSALLIRGVIHWQILFDITSFNLIRAL